MKLARKDLILKYIVEDFIETAEPVGSHSLLNKHKLQISSATVRNVMASLEKEGYLEKTHTSSGRVPSLEGYRYYIDKLRDERVDKTLRFELNNLLDGSKSIEQVLKEACQILSDKTELATCLFYSSVYDETLVKVEAKAISSDTFTIIFVTNTGYVENKTFVLNKNINNEYIVKIVDFINSEIQGARIIDINKLLDKSNLKLVSRENAELFTYVVHILQSTFHDAFSKRTSKIYGKSFLLEKPEFREDISEIKKLFDIFLNTNQLGEIFAECGEEVFISMGSGKYKNISIVTKEIKLEGFKQNLGRIAVIGPTRMNYDAVISSLNYVVSMISDSLVDLKEVDINE